MSKFRRALRQRLKDRGGFTLVETLIAFVVLATLLSVLFRGVVALGNGVAGADVRTHAANVARSVFNQALAARTLPDGTTSGVLDGRRWIVKATAFDLGAQVSASQGADKSPGWRPQRLVVDVDTGGRPVRVETIRLVKVR